MRGLTLFIYPASDLDRETTLLAQMGSFWARTYAGSGQVSAYAGSLGRSVLDVESRLDETVACISRATVPAFARREWRLAVLTRNSGGPMAVRDFGAAGVAFGDAGFRYGVPIGPRAYPTDLAGLVACGWAFNRLGTPSRSLAAGLDFALVPGGGVTPACPSIVFRRDPFDDPAWPRRTLLGLDGTAADEEMYVWLFDARLDRDDVWTHHGYVLGLRRPSSAAYAGLVDSLLDAAVGGTLASTLEAALSAATGVPLAGGDETVEVAYKDPRGGTVVVTDASTYACGDSPPTVGPGDTLAGGDALCGALALHELNRGVVPPSIDALALGPGMLSPSFRGELVFEGRDLPIAWSADAAGRPYAYVALGGFPGDVAAFWAEVHRRGVAAGRTLGEALDARPAPVGYPTAANLPGTLNPLRFLATNVLRGRAIVAVIEAAGLGRDAAGLGSLPLLRRVVPPGAVLLVLLKLPRLGDAATMTGEDRKSVV